MRRQISVMTGVALTLGTLACGSDADPDRSDEHRADTSALAVSADAPQASADEAAAPPTPAVPGADDGAGEPSDAAPRPLVLPRELDLPSYWSEAVADVCVSGSDVCAEGQCPTFADALGMAQRASGWAVRDYCVSDDGEPFISLGLTHDVGVIYVFRASGEVVSRIVSDDGPYHCADTTPSNREVTGRFIPDCLWVRDATTPCSDQAAPNLGSFESCFYDLRM
jgi:hypothetical protein